jgi:hypothetical protein
MMRFSLGNVWLVIGLAAFGNIHNATANDQLARIHSVAVVSLLGNQVDMQTQGTRFDYADYKLHTDWNFDDPVREYVTKAIQPRFIVTDGALDPQIFSGAKSGPFRSMWVEIGDRLRALPQKPAVDAVIVVHPEETDSTGYLSAGLAVTHDAPFLFNKGATTIAANYSVDIYDAKTGDRIDYGTGRFPASGYLTGYSPAREQCSNSVWADSEGQLSTDQKSRIHQELWSLLTRSLPYAMASAGLIERSDAESLSATSAVAGDSECHAI